MQRKLFKASFLLSLSLTACAGPQVKGPSVSIAFIEQSQNGIEVVDKTGKSVFLQWDDIKDSFLSGFDKWVCNPRDDYMALIEWGKRKQK